MASSDYCDCSSTNTGCESGGASIANRCGCGSHDQQPSEPPFCYVLGGAQCLVATLSTWAGGAAWRECELQSPPSAPPSVPLLDCCPVVVVSGFESLQPLRMGIFTFHQGHTPDGAPLYDHLHGEQLYWFAPCSHWQIGGDWREGAAGVVR